MKCPRCQHENPPQAKFCLECGARVALTCTKCRSELPAGAKFCLECGAPVASQATAEPARVTSPESYTPKHLAEKILTSKSALEGERKQVTVLFAASRARWNCSPIATPALAAKQATRTLPIVFFSVSDPVSSGLVTSLARPGGNVTGLSDLTPELVGKCLEQLKQAVPGVSRVAVFWQPGAFDERTEKDILKAAEVATRALGVRPQFVEARGPDDFDRAFSEMTRARAGALTVLPTAMFFNERRRVVDLAAKNRLPTVFPHKESVDAGGLMGYGPVLADLFRRAATYVDKILKGMKPADLPVEQPTKFELVVNLKTAKALGLTIPPSILGRADQVIE